jgi:hypothetical protein
MRFLRLKVQGWGYWLETIYSEYISSLQNSLFKYNDKPSPRYLTHFAWCLCWGDGYKWIFPSDYYY